MSASGWHRKKPTEADARRQREYNSAEYKAAKRAVKALVARGNAHCWRCGKYIPPGAEVHTGHDDHDRSIIRGAECPPCNRNTAASRAAKANNAKRNAAKRTPPRPAAPFVRRSR